MIVKLLLFVAVSYLHYYHISNLFENDRFFSHLSTLEREMTFRTEAGFYYSYYKTIVTAPSFIDGWRNLVNDTGTEYPSHINALQRFNVYPEVLVGGVFRAFKSVAVGFDAMDYFKVCYGINRGQGQRPVQSCVGAGDESIFYVNFIFVITGLQMGLLFLVGCHLSDNILGGILAVSCFFFNHGECTRVQWIPPLRESFSCPFLLLQTLFLSTILKGGSSSAKRTGLILATICFVLPWQFSQFVLLTQTLSLFGSYSLSFLSGDQVTPVLDSVFIGYAVGTALQFLNTMLISSMYLSSYLAFKIVLLLNARSRVSNRVLQFLRDVAVFVVLAVLFKMASAAALSLSDDAHIFNILKSKFTDFRDFHTLLYICGKAFDFIELETFYKLVMTLLLPTTLAVLVRLTCVFGKDLVAGHRDEAPLNTGTSTKPPDAKLPKKPTARKPGSFKVKKTDDGAAVEPAVSENYLTYHVFQFGCFFGMAVIVMRLKLFMTPYMCVLSSLAASDFVLPQSKKSRYIIVSLLLAAMSVSGYGNLQKQWKVEGEYNNPEQEQLFLWVEKHTAQEAVFAGSMPLMANLRLSTGRNIVNHPHYEDSGLRERTKAVYQMFSRKSGEEVYATLKSLRVEYAVLDKHWCTSTRPRSGCSIPEIWDHEDEGNRGRAVFCEDVVNYPHLFRLEYSNKVYRVLKIR